MRCLAVLSFLSSVFILTRCEMEMADVPGEHEIDIVPAKRQISYDLDGKRFYRELRGDYVGDWQEYKRLDEPDFDLDDDELPGELMMQEKRGRKRNIGNTNYNLAETKQILKKHNALRAQVSPSGGDMEAMVWDAELATLAQVWSDGCLYEHPDKPSHPEYSGVGQNLYIKWLSDEANPPDVEQPTQLWYDEVVDYHYNDMSCNLGKVCGHYTQVVWAKSNKVGCGVTYCPRARDNKGKTYKNAWLVTCNYSPAGNYVGQHPYASGKECSNCPDGTCSAGLCKKCNTNNKKCECKLKCKDGTLNASKCKCSCDRGYYGNTCEMECVDKHEWCGANPGWPDASACSFAPYVPEYCPKMCSKCT